MPSYQSPECHIPADVLAGTREDNVNQGARVWAGTGDHPAPVGPSCLNRASCNFFGRSFNFDAGI